MLKAIPPVRPLTLALLVSSFVSSALHAAPGYTFADAQKTLRTYCAACHIGRTAQAGFDLDRYSTLDSMLKDPRTWLKSIRRVREQEMPPKPPDGFTQEKRELLTTFLDRSLRDAACADGIAPGPNMVRRLNRAEYSATVRDLVNIQVNPGHALPADGAGGEGFDNAAETLFLSPMHAEKYLDAAKQTLYYAVRDPKSRARFMTVPGKYFTPDQAARQVLSEFIPRAFRRPAAAPEIGRYFALFTAAQKRGDTYDASVSYALQAVLISPYFLFRLEEPNPSPAPTLAKSHEMAARLSYFLWGTMPDDELFALAKKDKLTEPAILKAQVERMLKSDKTREFSERFVEQWLNTRELGRDIKPDAKLFPEYQDEEIASAMRYEPILYFQEVLSKNLSLLTLIDSDFTILTNKLFRHYGLKFEMKERLRQQPVRVNLPPGTHRGGITTMAAVLAVSSLPHRTSPVLRGKWVLDALLGTPPPPPPPNVPELKEHEGATPATLRERLMQHRQNPVCASCHNKIDPIGFGLENYDVLGRWRDNVDSTGELPDGTTFNGPDELKKVLLSKKELFLRNLTTKLLGYALGRGLTMEDYCTVDSILAALEKEGYSSQTLIREIVLSIPFRYKPGATPGTPVSRIQ